MALQVFASSQTLATTPNDKAKDERDKAGLTSSRLSASGPGASALQVPLTTTTASVAVPTPSSSSSSSSETSASAASSNSAKGVKQQPSIEEGLANLLTIGAHLDNETDPNRLASLEANERELLNKLRLTRSSGAKLPDSSALFHLFNFSEDTASSNSAKRGKQQPSPTN